MQETSTLSLSVSELMAERESRRRKEKEAEEQLAHNKDEGVVKFRERLDEFELSAAYAETLTQRIKRAFEHAESELLIVSFPSSFCTDSGRAISNVGEPPFNKSGKQAAQQAAPEWLHTLPKGAAVLYEFWKSTLQRGGFGFSARMISYPGGMPGDIGLFITWPKSGLEDKSSTS